MPSEKTVVVILLSLVLLGILIFAQVVAYRHRKWFATLSKGEQKKFIDEDEADRQTYSM